MTTRERMTMLASALRERHAGKFTITATAQRVHIHNPHSGARWSISTRDEAEFWGVEWPSDGQEGR